MAADSVGQIGLDLVVNKNEFDSQMLGIQNLAKKAGKALAAAFAVKKVFDFGKSCIELGSDLAEVQNVVDVTFSQMSKQVDKFAQNAATQFGLSETMAKRFTGTFGAMAKAFGFSEKAAYDIFMDAVNKMVDKSCDDETMEKIKACAMNIPGVENIDLLRTRVFGNKIYVDMEIAADGNKTLDETHAVAERVHDAIEQEFPKVKHIMVHVNPAKK